MSLVTFTRWNNEWICDSHFINLGIVVSYLNSCVVLILRKVYFTRISSNFVELSPNLHEFKGYFKVTTVLSQLPKLCVNVYWRRCSVCDVTYFLKVSDGLLLVKILASVRLPPLNLVNISWHQRQLHGSLTPMEITPSEYAFYFSFCY